MSDRSQVHSTPFVKRHKLWSRASRRLILLSLLSFFFPVLMIFYFSCGLADIRRNKLINKAMLKQYFLGHGTITWLMSPINLLADLLTLPNLNAGIYTLNDLPKAYQLEITEVINAMHNEKVSEQIADKLSGNAREMLFFKWYGKNIQTSLNNATFHQPYKYIKTIGVSVFNRKKSTSKHFGPMRFTLRVLYNINTIDSDEVYIEVGDVRHSWRKQKLFIFDDTLQHQSINHSDEIRYCAFIDIVRPSLFPQLMSLLTNIFGRIFNKLNHLFYNSWTFLK